MRLVRRLPGRGEVTVRRSFRSVRFRLGILGLALIALLVPSPTASAGAGCTFKLVAHPEVGSPPFDQLYGIDALTALPDAHRCVSVIGPGGVGKTRLALEFAARRHSERSPIVIELEHAEPDDVVPRIARALDLEAVPGADVLSSVATALASRPYLLVLDNIDPDLIGEFIDHVLDA